MKYAIGMNIFESEPLEILNREELIARLMGDSEMADYMLGRYLERAAEECDLIESVVRCGDRKAIASVAHRQKGTAKTMAVPRIAQAAEQLECRACTDSTADLLRMAGELRELHEELRAAVEASSAVCSR